MNTEKILLIVNPVAGTGQSRTALFGILSELCADNRPVTVMMTAGAGDATSLAEEFGGEYKTLACVGGDGTLSEILSGVMALTQDKRPDIGYIPMGTANDMAATFQLSGDPETAAKTVVKGEATSVDIGRLEDKYFGYVAAFGAFTEVSYSTPQDLKNTFGHLAYVFEGAKSVPQIKPIKVKIEHDGGVIEGEYIYGGVTNSLSLGGLMKLNPEDVDLSDGLLELLLVKATKSAAAMQKAVFGILTQNYNGDEVVLLHTKKAHFTFSEPVAWTRDGEAGGEYMEVTAENIHRAVKIIM